jgi:hypothetical protein
MQVLEVGLQRISLNIKVQESTTQCLKIQNRAASGVHIEGEGSTFDSAATTVKLDSGRITIFGRIDVEPTFHLNSCGSSRQTPKYSALAYSRNLTLSSQPNMTSINMPPLLSRRNLQKIFSATTWGILWDDYDCVRKHWNTCETVY